MLEASSFGWDSTSFDGGADPNQAFNAKDFQETYPNAGGATPPSSSRPRGARRHALKPDLIATLNG
jgi:hypothetical protein